VRIFRDSEIFNGPAAFGHFFRRAGRTGSTAGGTPAATLPRGSSGFSNGLFNTLSRPAQCRTAGDQGQDEEPKPHVRLIARTNFRIAPSRRPTSNPSQEGSRPARVRKQFPSWEGSGVGSFRKFILATVLTATSVRARICCLAPAFRWRVKFRTFPSRPALAGEIHPTPAWG